MEYVARAIKNIWANCINNTMLPLKQQPCKVILLSVFIFSKLFTMPEIAYFQKVCVK
jgi:hypothetical protein